ncbi:MAG: hypothetical protein IBX69_00110 [Anaerolineales bacterium]|nr:hypothetical protein [Anaerolineales bacterium]
MDMVLVGIFAFVCILVGFVLSSFLQALRSSKEESRETIQTAPGLKEVARLSRDVRTKHLVVEIGDQAFKSVGDLNPDDRQQLTMTAVDLRTWLGIFPSEEESGEREVYSAQPADFSVSTPSSPDADLQSMPEVAQRKPSLNPLKMFSEAIQESRKPVEGEIPKRIVAQIDEILQGKLETSPLSGRGVRLVELPGEGIAVMVGLTRYNDVEDVPDAEIRDIIHEAVNEWESGLTARL